MRSNYRLLGKYIRQVDNRNKDLKVDLLLGVSIKKKFMPSIANIVGTNMRTYKIIEQKQFAYGPVTSRNGDKISVSLLENHDQAIVSQAYTVFEIIDHNKLDPEYLMMWFRRSEFDRYARFKSHGSAREVFDWEEMCKVEFPVPSTEKQREIVKEYNIISNRIKLNETLNQKLEETAQTIYKHWFVDFEFPISKEYAEKIGKPELEGKPYKSNGGEMIYCDELDQEIPRGWKNLSLSKVVNTQYGYTASATSKNIGPKFLRITDIAQEYVEWNSVPHCQISTIDIKKYLLKEGDVVVARTGATVGYAKRINKSAPQSIFASYLVRITPKEKLYLNFVGLTVISEFFKKFIQNVAGGSGQPQASAKLMTEYKMVAPSNESLEKFNTIIQSSLNLSENYQTEISNLIEMKEYILVKMTKIS